MSITTFFHWISTSRLLNLVQNFRWILRTSSVRNPEGMTFDTTDLYHHYRTNNLSSLQVDIIFLPRIVVDHKCFSFHLLMGVAVIRFPAWSFITKTFMSFGLSPTYAVWSVRFRLFFSDYFFVPTNVPMHPRMWRFAIVDIIPVQATVVDHISRIPDNLWITPIK